MSASGGGSSTGGTRGAGAARPPRRSARRRRGGGDEGHGNQERWLLTYADMITLLMALFIVMYAFSSVNVSKLRVLQNSLEAAFSGPVVPGGDTILDPGSSATGGKASPDPKAIVSEEKASDEQPIDNTTRNAIEAAQREQENFERLKRRLDAYAQQHGIASQVETTVARRGLVIRILTDDTLFLSGSAELERQGMPLLGEVARLIGMDRVHPVAVEGHTDNVPISTAVYPSNWELSTARATRVVRFLIGRRISSSRLGASGYADLHPLATNNTAAGRQRNRRVEIVLARRENGPGGRDVPGARIQGTSP